MSIRFTYFLALIVICFLLATSVYLQIVEGIIPCPLCTLQRFTFGLLGICFLFGIFLSGKRWGRLLIHFCSATTALIGVTLAGRQVWLQQFHSSDGVECGVSLDYMLQVLPLNEVMKKVFAGSSECAQRGWEFLSFNMAEWSLACFIGFFLLIVYLFLKEPGLK